MLQESLTDAEPGARLREVARAIVARHRERRLLIPGLGHPTHKGVDPRVPRLFQVATENGLAGRQVELVQLVAEEASTALSRPLPVNATGAIGAIAGELEIPWQVCRGLAVMARAIGLVAHLDEERGEPLAAEIWSRAEEEASEGPIAP
jgi:citrate synthase